MTRTMNRLTYETAVSEGSWIKIRTHGEIYVNMINAVKEDCDRMVKKGKWTKQEADYKFKKMRHKIIERALEIEKEIEEYEKEREWRKNIFRH